MITVAGWLATALGWLAFPLADYRPHGSPFPSAAERAPLRLYRKLRRGSGNGYRSPAAGTGGKHFPRIIALIRTPSPGVWFRSRIFPVVLYRNPFGFCAYRYNLGGWAAASTSARIFL
jgi:hypothetical protein